MMASAIILPFAGVGWTRWLFALRIWAAVMLALGVAFWLELDGASSAGVCVAILALQTRGQVLEKALYRALGTVVGAIASIVLTDVFLQTRDLYIIAYSAWLGLCVFTAGFLDGNRAYGAVLCGYTVAIVAIQRIDTPEEVFSAAIDRCAAIIIGIAAISLVNTLFSAPEITSVVLERVCDVRARVRVFTAKLLHLGGGPATDSEAAQILSTISDRHLDMEALSTETLVGTSRAAAARAVAAALVGETVIARQLATIRERGITTLGDIVSIRLQNQLSACRIAEKHAVRALEAGHSLPDTPAMPVYRSWENAFRNALRAFLTSIAAGFACALTGWSATELTWSFVGILICLTATAPDPRDPARAALFAMPAGAALAGFTLFILLDGSDAFPLLCAGLLPGLIGGALLLSSPNPGLARVGSLLTVFMLVVIKPANPQTYDPLTYLIMSALMIMAAIIVYVVVSVFPPVEDSKRRVWVLRSARRALEAALRGKTALSGEEALLLDASRIATLSTLKDCPGAPHATDLAMMFWLADLRSAAQRTVFGLDRLRAGYGPSFVSLRRTTCTAFQDRNVDGLWQAASTLAASGHPSALIVAGDIGLAAHLLETAPDMQVRKGAPQ